MSGRILFVFTPKSIIYATAFGLVGAIFLLIFNIIGIKIIGAIITAIFALIGFVIGTFKIPELEGIPFTKKTGRRKRRHNSKKGN